MGHQHGCRFTVLTIAFNMAEVMSREKGSAHHFHRDHNAPFFSPPPPPPTPTKKIHNRCFHFLLGITVVPRQIEGNVHAKFWGGKQGELWFQ